MPEFITYLTKIMSELKIEINQLKNYLGTGLNCSLHDDECEIVGLDLNYEGASLISKTGWFYRSEILFIKPIVYRLSDLDKYIPELGFVPIEELSKYTTTEINGNGEIESTELDGDLHITEMPDEMDWYRMQLLFKWHFWPFDQSYFDQGFVIDKMNYHSSTL